MLRHTKLVTAVVEVIARTSIARGLKSFATEIQSIDVVLPTHNNLRTIDDAFYTIQVPAVPAVVVRVTETSLSNPSAVFSSIIHT